MLKVFSLGGEVRLPGQREAELVGPWRVRWLQALVAELLDDFLSVYILGEPNSIRGSITVNRKA